MPNIYSIMPRILGAFLGTLLMFPQVSHAGLPQGAFKVTSESDKFSFDLGQQRVICARPKRTAQFVPVINVKPSKYVQPIKNQIADLSSALRAATQRRQTSKKRKIAAQRTAAQKKLKEQTPLCRRGHAPKNPKAISAIVQGAGWQPISLVLSADPGIAGQGIVCEIANVPSSITVAELQECRLFITPKHHRIGEVTFSYTVRRPSDGAVSLPASIQVSWRQDGQFVGDVNSLGIYKDSLSREEAQYLIHVAGLGDRMLERTHRAMQPGGLDAIVDELLHVSSAPECAAIEDAAIAAGRPDMNTHCVRSSVTPPNQQTISLDFCPAVSDENRVHWTVNAAAARWIYALRHGCNPLRERMGLLWHNHFAVNLSSIGVGGNNPRSHYINEHLEALRSISTGGRFIRIDELLARMHGKDGAMGMWLDNRRNSFSNLGGNENYARELLELFTLGPNDIVTGSRNYTEEHIYDMRFAVMGYSDELNADSSPLQTFTGCCDATCVSTECTACAALPAEEQCRQLTRSVTNPHFYNSRWNTGNQPFQPTLFVGMPWERRDVFKADAFSEGGDNVTGFLLAAHPGVARYFAARLIATFLTQEPTNEMVQTVADLLVRSGWDPAPALRMIFSSSSFFSKSNRFDSVTNPVENLITLSRGLGLPLERVAGGENLLRIVQDAAGTAGFSILQMPSVFGVPEAGKIAGNKIHSGVTFLSTQRVLERMRGVSDYLNRIRNTINANRTNFRWEHLLPGGAANRSPESVLDHISNMVGVTPSATERASLISYLTTASPRRITQNGLVIPDGSFMRTINWQQLSELQFQQFIELKIPGLIAILAASPEFNLR